jgi:hypothetical protein
MSAMFAVIAVVAIGVDKRSGTQLGLALITPRYRLEGCATAVAVGSAYAR